MRHADIPSILMNRLPGFVRKPVPLTIGASTVAIVMLSLIATADTSEGDASDERGIDRGEDIVVIAYNDLGMHCMNDDFADMLILPPFNTMRAQVIKRKDSPEPIVEDVTVTYSVPSNTHAASKSNFWTHSEALFGAPIPPGKGLTGVGMHGEMEPVQHGSAKYWEVVGVPITPYNDTGRLNPYPLASIKVEWNTGSAETIAVMPVSMELDCNLCHRSEGVSIATDILRAHDRLHDTDLENNRPVLCASCHADNALGAPGQPGISSFSHAMHRSHADRLHVLNLDNDCYSCHPGLRTECWRDVHFTNGLDCSSCHGDMHAMGDPSREPWLEQPRCADCHNRAGFEFEPPGVLFKDATGHGGILCATCHNSPHAISPAAVDTDNQQSLFHQGYSGVLSDCTVCHTQTPSDPFVHRHDDN